MVNVTLSPSNGLKIPWAVDTKYKTKHNPKISILRNQRYGLKQDEK